MQTHTLMTSKAKSMLIKIMKYNTADKCFTLWQGIFVHSQLDQQSQLTMTYFQ